LFIGVARQMEKSEIIWENWLRNSPALKVLTTFGPGLSPGRFISTSLPVPVQLDWLIKGRVVYGLSGVWIACDCII
jgi:hypothetical protein